MANHEKNGYPLVGKLKMKSESSECAPLSRRQIFLRLAIVLLGLFLFIGIGMHSLSLRRVLPPELAALLQETKKVNEEFNEEVQRLIDEGEPVSLEELWPEEVSDSENANFHYWEAAWLQFDRADKNRGKSERFVHNVAERLGKPGVCVKRDKIEQRTLEALDRAAACERSQPLIRSPMSLGNSLDTLRPPMLLERRRLLKALNEEHYEAVAEIALRQFGFIKVLRNEPGDHPDNCSFNSARHLIRHLNQLLRLGRLSGKLLDRLDAKLAAVEHASPHLLHKAKESRALYIEDIQRTGKTLMKWAFLDQTKMLELYEHQISLAQQPYFQVKDQFHPDVPTKTTGTSVAYWNNEFTFDQRHARWHYMASAARCLRILIAIEKYRKLNQLDPTSIEDLDLPAHCLRATIADSPITMLKKEDGWWVTWKWDDQKSGLIGYPPDSISHYGGLPPGCIPPEPPKEG